MRFFHVLNNLKKSILVDYSYQYIGLHLADIVAAAFTNALIRQTRGAGFPFAGELYSEIIAKTYELVRTEGFPALKIGSRIVIPKDELQEWVKRNTGVS